jgi:hypothetical protein
VGSIGKLILPAWILSHFFTAACCRRCGKAANAVRVSLPDVSRVGSAIRLNYLWICQCDTFNPMRVEFPLMFFCY